MRRPNYSVVTGCTVVVAAVCAVRLGFQRFIPPPRPGIAKWARGDYVLQAQETDIDWRPPGPAAFAEAQQLSRPLVLVIGLPWSAAARQAEVAFLTPEVARTLNRGFVPVRIDAARDPRWAAQFLPLERARSGLDNGFQVWVLDLKGRVIGFVARGKADDDLRGGALLDALLQSQTDFARAALDDATPPFEATQQADVARLLQPGFVDLTLPDAARVLAAGLDPEWGGWSVRDLVAARPLAYRFLQLAGHDAETGAALRSLLRSPLADGLDGGLYRVARRDLRAPEFDKPSVTNAWSAEALAVQNALRPAPALRRAARRGVDWLLALCADDLVPGAEVGDEDERGRSARASFPPARLRDLVASGTLSAEARRWAEERLGLAGGARVVVPTADALRDVRMGDVLALLREAAGPRRKAVANELCDVNATVAACLLRCARLWDDRHLANAAGEIVDRLESFQPTVGLRHSLLDGSEVPGYLGDALAYADAQLADFLTNGRVPSLERGAAMLRRALGVFGGPEAGVLRPSPVGTALLSGLVEVPEVTDDEREAPSAAALRLLNAYAAVLGPDGKDLLASADGVATNLAAVVSALPAMGGTLGALSANADRRAALVVGPDALERASRLARRLPNRLVVPVLGPARPDMRDRPRGVYVVSPKGLVGPLSEDEAVRLLPNALRLDK